MYCSPIRYPTLSRIAFRQALTSAITFDRAITRPGEAECDRSGIDQ